MKARPQRCEDGIMRAQRWGDDGHKKGQGDEGQEEVEATELT
jgi:hypothetical protein